MNRYPLSGDVLQAINPWSWWLNSLRMFGFINIYQTGSNNPQLEQQIVETTASYGQQLGRINDTLSVILSVVELDSLNSQQQQAVQQFRQMVTEIEALKSGYQVVDYQQTNAFIAGLEQLKQQDPEKYSKIIALLKAKLQAE